MCETLPRTLTVHSDFSIHSNPLSNLCVRINMGDMPSLSDLMIIVCTIYIGYSKHIYSPQLGKVGINLKATCK